MRRMILAVPVICAAMFAESCSSIDCPLNNTVYSKFKLMGDVTTLTHKLTVSISRSDGSDSVLLNQAENTDSFMIPMSYKHDADVYYFEVSNGTVSVFDTVTVSKTNEPHFESVDCTPSVFHNINKVSYTRNLIDSIGINNPIVNYDATKAHFHIYFKSNAE